MNILSEYGSVASFSTCFFFQAEDGIRDWSVTGVQTCALPIFAGARWQKLPRVPSGVKHPRFESCFESVRARQLRVQRRATHLQMRVQRFARDEQAHDLAGAFKNRVRSEERRVGKESR